mgnify:CR=1 FL=1
MNLDFLTRLYATSIGRKLVMSVTGLFLSAFIMFHLSANLLLLKGAKIFNGFVGIMEKNPALPLLETGLFLIFILHILMGAWVRWEDWKNRPHGYERRKWQGGRTVGSATMLYTAPIILLFLLYHLFTFRFVDHSMGYYEMAVSAFRSQTYVIIYIAGFAALLLHLSHGVQSAFQTLGINHPKYTPWIKIAGWFFAIISVTGFTVIPLYFFFGIDAKTSHFIIEIMH